MSVYHVALRQRAKHKLLRGTFSIRIPVFLSYGKIGFEPPLPHISGVFCFKGEHYTPPIIL